jgi:hypothetical protein
MRKNHHPPTRYFLALHRKLTSIILLSFFSLSAFALTMITDDERQAVYEIGAEHGVPLSIVRALMKEESGGYVDAVSHKTAEGYVSRGLFQLYDKPGNIEWLLWKFWRGGDFNINNPVDNALVAMPYLASLHKRFGNWYQALVYYNHGNVAHYPEGTRAYAKRIINAK